MGLRDKIVNMVRRLLPGRESKSAPFPRGQMVHEGMGGYGSGDSRYGLSWLTDLVPGADFDYEAEAGDPWRNSALAACLRVLKANFPQPELEVARRDVEGDDYNNPIPGHKLVALWNRPNKGYDRFTLEAGVVLSAVCDGNAYLLIVRSAAGIPVELWWVPPWMLEPCWDASGAEFITHYEYYVNGRTYFVDPKDVVHFRFGGPDPRNPRKAMSEVKAAAARILCSLNEADGFTAAILRNSGIPSVVITPEGNVTLDPTQRSAFRETWKEKFGGENRGEPYVASKAVKVIPLGFTPEQLKLDAIPARLEDQICALTGVNAMVAGLTSGAQHKTYENMAQARRGFYEDTLIPMQLAFASCLEHSLLGQVGMGNPAREFVRFSYVNIACMQEQQTEVWHRVGEAYQVHQTIKRSEAREAMGLEWDDEDEVFYDETKPLPPAPFGPGGGPGGDDGEGVAGGGSDPGTEPGDAGDAGSGEDEDGPSSGDKAQGGRGVGGRRPDRVGANPRAAGGGRAADAGGGPNAVVVVLSRGADTDPFGSASPGRGSTGGAAKRARPTPPLERVRTPTASRRARRSPGGSGS